MGKVSVVRSESRPSDADVFTLVKRAVDLVGGIESIVKTGDIVALKPNVVTGRVSGPGVTTDKRVIEALIKLCRRAGAGQVKIVEGAGYFSDTDDALRLSGVKAMAESQGVEVVNVDKDDTVELKVKNPRVIDRVKVSKAFMEADVRINIPVMKTHDQLLVTLGVKNLKGILQKPMKRNFHRIGVVKAIIDLYSVVPIDLTVLDALVAMEGLGPSFGPKVNLTTIIASRDTFALDRVASGIMGFKPNELDYLKEGASAGFTNLEEEIEVVGEPLSSFTHKFERPPTDLEFADEVKVISEGACSACRGTIHSVFYDIERMKMMGEIRDLFIVVGSNAEVPENLTNTPIIMGTCLKKFENKGCYVEGCPPNNDKMLAAIKEVCNIPD